MTDQSCPACGCVAAGEVCTTCGADLYSVPGTACPQCHWWTEREDVCTSCGADVQDDVESQVRETENADVEEYRYEMAEIAKS